MVGLMALTFSPLYFISDVIEAAQGGFSAGQLWLTLVSEAAIPIFVVGLAAAQRPRLLRAGLLGAAAYAYSYVVFTGTVVYALAHDIDNYRTLSEDLDTLMLIHGAIMVLAGIAFAYAVWQAKQLPRWTALALAAGVVLVALTQDAPQGVQLVAAGVRALAFAGMGAALLLTRNFGEPS